MRKRQLGNTEIEISELCLGTWGLSGEGYGPVSVAERERVIDRARALGVTCFETADSYASGETERLLGARFSADARVVIVTKVGTDREASPPRKRFDASYLKQAVERSAERLRRERLDVVLLHNPSLHAVESGDATSLMEDLRAAGTLRAWGVSAGNADVARVAVKQGAGVVELAYNIMFSRDVAELEGLWLESKPGLLARSVLSYGLLCGHWPPHKMFPDGDHRAERWTADDLRRRVRQLDAVRTIVGGDVHTMRAAALRFVLSNEHVSGAVLGPRSTVQLDQLVREAGREPPYLAPEKLEKLRSALEEVGVETW